ncbi:hypothetical protein CEXT_315871 [Caerostris extrusa]|uniref:Uncharacterized protein n=1 Tax=Caerostris extrusa TaxID=172846 RepID=A0AAV4TBF4_CAEEX|nr:hypothetical protein CEXT_315871 [Caerostris extrusa]
MAWIYGDILMLLNWLWECRIDSLAVNDLTPIFLPNHELAGDMQGAWFVCLHQTPTDGNTSAHRTMCLSHTNLLPCSKQYWTLWALGSLKKGKTPQLGCERKKANVELAWRQLRHQQR